MTVINPLTASILGIFAAGENITLLKIIGYILILLALYLYNARKRNAEKDDEH